ncbi:MAG: hypothetical protein A3I66_05815 [Burkholderiales bacterium RIFCSPLOWO2_02_FULL_57_36]|nr:MAG: hypothetical protein A3I66_05815 [Burkholderiales bacterium RIFCSPLOWO2_02_FULL_57_36]
MSRSIKIFLWSGIGILVALALCLLLLATFDWNRAKPWLSSRVADATGRPFAINGDLSLIWNRSRSNLSGWRRMIPWPLFSARDVTLGNPDWADASPNMAEIGHATFSINPLALLNKKIAVPTLVLDQPNLTLQRAAGGKNNWTLKSGEPSAWQFELGRLALNEGRVRVVDAIKKADITIAINTLDENRQTDGYRTGWKVAGSFDGAKVSGKGKAGPLLALQEQEQPYPIDADLQIGKTEIDVKGTLTKPRSLAAADIRLKLSGASMAHLYPITGILLPETPPFATEGRLQGARSQGGGDWTYQKFSGKVGSSDLAGTLRYESGLGLPRPHLTGTVESRELRFEDLGPLIGADSSGSKARRGAPAGKALPTQAFRTERWTSIDADVEFKGRKIIRGKNLPIDDLVAELHMKDGVLSFTPLNFGVADGNLTSTIKLDGRDEEIKAEMKISARRLKLNELFPTFQAMQASLGEINGDAELSGTGNSVSALLASSNGEVKMLIDQGTISKLLLEQIGLNVGSVVLIELFGDRQVRLNCLAGDFAVTNGLMQARTFVLDTEEAVLPITGNIDLAKEQLDLTIRPQSKGLRLVSLRTPLYVTGSFKKPAINVDKGVLAAKAGSAVALSIFAPVATALLPLINAGEARDSGCSRLLTEAKKNPVAPPPGKSYRNQSKPAQGKKAG